MAAAVPARLIQPFVAPHRIMFLGGALQALAAFAWWFVDIGARYGG